MINDFALTEHFRLREFQCKCGCGTVKLDPSLVWRLQALRYKVGGPLVINSGYRCQAHNKAVGGADNSFHMQGLAADVACPKGLTVEQFTQMCLELGFTGVGAYPDQGFVHVDMRPGPQVRFQ
ncbi:YcbK family protein [Candidatus Darwinibacter acetoxidans]